MKPSVRTFEGRVSLTLSVLGEDTRRNATDVFFTNTVKTHLKTNSSINNRKGSGFGWEWSGTHLRSEARHVEEVHVSHVGEADQRVFAVFLLNGRAEEHQSHLPHSTAFMSRQLKLGLRTHFRKRKHLDQERMRSKLHLHQLSDSIFYSQFFTLSCSSEAMRTEWALVMSGAMDKSWDASYGSGSGFPRPSSTQMDTTGALCISWISLPSTASTHMLLSLAPPRSHVRPESTPGTSRA